MLNKSPFRNLPSLRTLHQSLHTTTLTTPTLTLPLFHHRLTLTLSLSLPTFPSTPPSPPPHLALASPSLHAEPLSNPASEGNPIAGWWDGLLRAVPKKKVSHSRKSMRSANKGLKDRVDMVHCPACSRPKLQHHICAYCYSEINRKMKQELRGAANEAGEVVVEAKAESEAQPKVV